MSEAELAALTAQRASETARRERVDAEYDRIRIEQYHVHLPKLDAVDVIDWNRDRRSVTERDGVADELIDAARASDPRGDGTEEGG